ncbi:DJC12 protein, partial [Mionectes macconnelli]|nr:DJC12 protein [Mionectes macconnelli]
MDAILNCSAENLEDYYNLLGCDELSTVEQIHAEYKIKFFFFFFDKHPGNPKAGIAGFGILLVCVFFFFFLKLQQAKEVLTNEESRARYDYWRRSKITIPFQQWFFFFFFVKTSMHWAFFFFFFQMLEAPDFSNTNITFFFFFLRMENNEDGLLEGSRGQEDVAISDVKPQSSKNPDSPRFFFFFFFHLHFRWSGDAPSDLFFFFFFYEI